MWERIRVIQRLLPRVVQLHIPKNGLSMNAPCEFFIFSSSHEFYVFFDFSVYCFTIGVTIDGDGDSNSIVLVKIM